SSPAGTVGLPNSESGRYAPAGLQNAHTATEIPGGIWAASVPEYCTPLPLCDAPVIDGGRICRVFGSVSTIVTSAGLGVLFWAVMVQCVWLRRATLAGVQALVSVPGAWRRTPVTGSTGLWPWSSFSLT